MKRLLLIVGLLFLAGCGQRNLTWTPTQEEWQLMTPTERNDWFRSENEARQRKADAWQRAIDSLPSETETRRYYENRARRSNRDNDLNSIEQSLQGIDSSLKARRYGY